MSNHGHNVSIEFNGLKQKSTGMELYKNAFVVKMDITNPL